MTLKEQQNILVPFVSRMRRKRCHQYKVTVTALCIESLPRPYHSPAIYQCCRETLGNAFGNPDDPTEYCAGYNIEQLAKKGSNYIELPYVVKGMDISLSGLLTYIEQAAPELLKSQKASQEDLCFSLQVAASVENNNS